jgi:hypothetical protein
LHIDIDSVLPCLYRLHSLFFFLQSQIKVILFEAISFAPMRKGCFLFQHSGC